MPTPRPAIRRATLERLSRPLLARFLTAHAAEFCAAHGLSVDALAASDPRDRTLVHRFFSLVQPEASSAAPGVPVPDEAARWLATLDVLATSRGGEQLIALDTERALPRAKLGDEDFALTAILDRPELARSVASLLPADMADGLDSFTEYDPADLRPLHLGDAERASVEALLGVDLEALGRTSYCKMHVTHEPRRIALEIEYCRRPKTRDKLDVEALAVAPSTEVNTERAYAEIDLATRRLAVHAPHAAMKEMIRRALGRALASSPQHFRAARVYDLAPFRNLEAALSTEGVDRRLLGVELHALTVRTPAESEIEIARARRDIRGDAAIAPLLAEATKVGAPVGVRLYLRIFDRRAPLRVELSAKSGRNRLQFNRKEPEVVAIVQGYFIARGVMRELAPEAEAADAEAVG